MECIEKTFKLGKKVSIEFEDTNGNTIGGINLDTGECFGVFSIADLDGDYLFDSENVLVRVQLD